jgi:hypothetical protein
MGKRVERADSSRANYSVDLKLRSQAPMEKIFASGTNSVQKVSAPLST